MHCFWTLSFFSFFRISVSWLYRHHAVAYVAHAAHCWKAAAMQCRVPVLVGSCWVSNTVLVQYCKMATTGCLGVPAHFYPLNAWKSVPLQSPSCSAIWFVCTMAATCCFKMQCTQCPLNTLSPKLLARGFRPLAVVYVAHPAQFWNPRAFYFPLPQSPSLYCHFPQSRSFATPPFFQLTGLSPHNQVTINICCFPLLSVGLCRSRGGFEGVGMFVGAWVMFGCFLVA